MKKGITSVLLCVVMVIGLVFGCGSKGDGDHGKKESNGEGLEGKKLTIAVEDGGEYAKFYESIKGEFEEKSGATVELLGAEKEAVLSECMAKSGYYDVLTMDGPLIPQYASLGYLLPLDKYIEDEDKNDFLDAALESVSWEGSTYCMPYLVHSPVLYYRTDLLEEAGFDHPPTTTEEYLEIAKALTNKDAGVYGTIIEGKQEGEPVSQFLDKLSQFKGELVSSKDPDKIAFNSPETIKTFEYIKKFYKEGAVPKESANYNNGDVQNMFLQGQLALACNWPYMWSMVNDEEYSKVVGKVGVVAQPEANAAWSWSFGVSPDSKNIDLAVEWCKWATSSDVIKKLAEEFINPAVRKSSGEGAVKAITDENDMMALEGMNKSLEQAIPPTLSVNYSELRERVALTLNRISSGEASDIESEVKKCTEDLQSILVEAQ